MFVAKDGVTALVVSQLQAFLLPLFWYTNETRKATT